MIIYRLTSLLCKLCIVCYRNLRDILIVIILDYIISRFRFYSWDPYLVYFYSNIVICSHVICTCTFFSFYTLIECFLTPLDFQVYGYFFGWAGIWGDNVYLRSAESHLLDHPDSLILFMFFFSFCWFSLILYIYSTCSCSVDYSQNKHYHCVDLYVYCSDINYYS